MGDDKGHSDFASVMVPIIVAVITVVGVLGAAIFSNWDKLFPQKLSTQATPESKTMAVPSAGPVGARSIPLKTKGPLFIVVPPGAEGASIGAHILNTLQVEGFRIANGRDGAKLLIEIQSPDLGLPQASAVDGLDGFSVVTTLAAKMSPTSDDTGDVVHMQRQALGVGTTEIEARRNSIAAATDRLGNSIAESLR